MFAYTDFPGTGNEKVTVPRLVQSMYNNIICTPEFAKEFLGHLSSQPGREFYSRLRVSFRKPTPKYRWGTARYTYETEDARILLYRHSAWILIHEMAHIECWYKHSHWGHGEHFGAILDSLYRELKRFTITSNWIDTKTTTEGVRQFTRRK